MTPRTIVFLIPVSFSSRGHHRCVCVHTLPAPYPTRPGQSLYPPSHPWPLGLFWSCLIEVQLPAVIPSPRADQQTPSFPFRGQLSPCMLQLEETHHSREWRRREGESALSHESLGSSCWGPWLLVPVPVPSPSFSSHKPFWNKIYLEMYPCNWRGTASHRVFKILHVLPVRPPRSEALHVFLWLGANLQDFWVWRFGGRDADLWFVSNLPF